MRWIVGVAVLLAVGVGPALAVGPCHSCQMQQPAVYAAPACAMPGFGLTPGCCEPRRPCCENVWAGYCMEKACKRAFWSRLGHRCGVHRYEYCGPAADCGCSSGVVAPRPTPASEPADAAPMPPSPPAPLDLPPEPGA